MKKTIALITAALLLALAAFPGAAGTAPEAKEISYSSPAICAETGKPVDLKSYGVQFEYGGRVTPGADVTWKSGNAEIDSFTPQSDGVFTLTASAAGKTKRVYVVAAPAGASEYVLYENDFSSDPRSSLTVVQQTSGALIQHDASAGTLILDGTPPSDGYIRVLFPDFLDDFGDLIIDCSLKLESYKSATSRWGSVMFRVQERNYPYMQAALRYNSSANNGCEIAERTSANAWNVLTTAAGSASNSSFNSINVNVRGGLAEYAVNGQKVITRDGVPYSRGGVGLQVRGTRMVVDSIKITVNPLSDVSAGRIPGGYATVSEEKGNIALAPFLVGQAWEAAKEDKLPVTVYNLTDVSGQTAVVMPDGRKISLDEAFDDAAGVSIPCFRTASAEVASRLASYLKANDLRDVYLLTDSSEILKSAKSVWSYVNGVLDFSFFSGDDPEPIRSEAVKAGARTLIISDSLTNKKAVAYLQDRYMNCWAEVSSDYSAVRAINSGVYGLVVSDAASAERVCMLMKDLYPANTLVRYSNVIGHRGVPSLAQENSVAGSRKAFELGACMVENDIHLSSDGVLVVMHDATIDRTTNGTGSISSMTYAQISEFQIVSKADADPQPVPTLEDYFKEFCNGEKIVIELKNNNANVAAPLAEMIKRYDMERNIVVISFYTAPIDALRKLMPDVPAAWLNSSIAPNENDPISYLASVMDVIQPCGTVFSPSYAKGSLGYNAIRTLMYRGVSTWIWTVNDISDFNRYFLMGVRGITTNYSQWAKDYVKSVEVSIEDGVATVTGETYSGEKKDLTKSATLKVVDDGGAGISFDPATGKLSAGAGTAKFFFAVSTATSTRDKYWLVTEPVSQRFEGAAQTTAEQTAEQSGPEETTLAEPEVTTAEEGKKGCGSFAAGTAAMAVAAVSSAAAAQKKRKMKTED